MVKTKARIIISSLNNDSSKWRRFRRMFRIEAAIIREVNDNLEYDIN